MESRQTIDEQIYIQIQSADTYHKDVSGESFKNIFKEILDTDIIKGFVWKESKGGFMRDPDDTFYSPCIVVIRKRPENDEEFSKRMKEKAEREKQTEERERLEYLRSKAKYENI